MNASSDASAAADDTIRGDGSRRRHRARRARGRGLLQIGTWLCVSVLVAAPLLVGGVHRGTMIALMSATLVALAAIVAGLAWQGRTLRLGVGAALLVLFVLVPLLQSLPLPLSVRGVFDRAGTTLLRDNQIVPTTTWPLSLDPPNTRVEMGRAAAALGVFLIVYHLASGKNRRQLVVRAVAATGIAAVAIGLGHGILGVASLYGVFHVTPRALLAGPFVNPNHTAEFLELAAFVCLACSFQRPTTLNRIGWLIGTLLCAGGAAATLSRGAVLALAAGTIFFMVLRYRVVETGVAARRRISLAWGGILLGVILLGAAALGAGQLVGRFKTDAVSTDVRLKLWRQGLSVFAAHPFGIGRGAFDRVFPIYRSFTLPFSIRFAFVENQPLQLLIDCGWLFFLLIGAAAVTVGWQIARHGRRDKIEAALVAGLFVVMVHGIVDFGLETLGVLLPFTAILATVLGRLRPSDRESTRGPYAVSAFALATLVAGIASTAHPSYDDFDRLLRKHATPAEHEAILARAEATHPLDYFYALTEAQLRPLQGPVRGPSPRLHALNRALRLCPFCEEVHETVARSLWHLGLRRQALLEWRTAVDLQPHLLLPLLGELFSSGATAQDLAAVASSKPANMMDLVAFLQGRGRLPEAFAVLDQATAIGAPIDALLVLRAGLELDASKLEAAAETVRRAKQAGIQDPRLPLLEARILTATPGDDNGDQAIAVLDLAAARYPTDISIQRARLELVMRYEKWKAASRALDGLKSALYQQAGQATEAHIAEARIERHFNHWSAALDEYRIALAERPNDVSLWVEYAKCADAIGRLATAREAYQRASALSPNSPDVVNASKELDSRLERLRATATGPGTESAP